MVCGCRRRILWARIDVSGHPLAPQCAHMVCRTTLYPRYRDEVDLNSCKGTQQTIMGSPCERDIKDYVKWLCAVATRGLYKPAASRTYIYRNGKWVRTNSPFTDNCNNESAKAVVESTRGPRIWSTRRERYIPLVRMLASPAERGRRK